MSIGLAQAADLSPPPAALAAPLPYAVSWNGFYAGVNAGYGWGNVAVTNYDEDPITHFSNSASGFLAGGQLGYNWQAGNFVFGPEFDLGWLGLSGSTAQSIDTLIVSRVSGGLYGDATARIGIASGPTLFYAKGGWAFFNGTVNVTDLGESSTSTTHTSGWTIGAGIEHKFSPHWSGKLEYQYFSFGNDRLVLPSDGDRFDNVLTASTIKVGLNYAF
jgi:outer membrane immunogenic protein